MNRSIISFFIFAFVVLMLGLSVKGHRGEPIYYQSEHDIGGPFELSNSRSRYILTEAIVENKSITFNQKQARFAAPDLVGYNDKLFSVFTPGVSFVGVPFYILGKQFGMPQLFTYISTVLFALLNAYLIMKLGTKLGANRYGALIGGAVFLFGTSALSYALSFTQHHISTTLILLALLNALSDRSFFKNILLGLIFAAGLLMDIPNGFMMFPIVVYAFIKNIKIEEIQNKLKLSLRVSFTGLVIGLIPLLFLFGWYNRELTGSYTTLTQSIGRVDVSEAGEFMPRKTEANKEEAYAHRQVYSPRRMLRGIYILLISNERGWFYYSPIVVVGILGLILAYKKKENRIAIVLASAPALICFVSYSMFSDPWGGWSFGPRYLIPASALVSVGIGVAIMRFKKNPLFILIFFLLVTYSVAVNSLGAMTTSAIPPKVEATNLQTPIPYTYEYNLKFVEENRSSSLIYNLWLYRYSSFLQFLIVFIASELMLIGVLYALSVTKKLQRARS